MRREDDDDDDDDGGIFGERQLEVCIRSATCSQERDPEQFCRDAAEDCAQDEQCAEVQRRCADINDIFIDCLLESGTCDTIDGVDGTFFGVEATGADGACEDLAQRSSACASGE